MIRLFICVYVVNTHGILYSIISNAQLNKVIFDLGLPGLCNQSGDWMKSLRMKIAENTSVNKVSFLLIYYICALILIV